MSSDAPSNSALGQPFEGAGKSSPGETENRLGDLSLGEGGDQRAGSPSLLPSRNSLDRSRSPSSHAGLSSPGERTQQGLGSTAHLGVQRRSPSPQPGSPFSFPCTSSASSTPVGTPTLPSASLPVFSTSGGPPGRSNSLSGVSSPDPFNFAGSPSLSNRPLEAAKHQHHRSRSINMGGFSPVMKGGKLINFGSGPVSISAPGGESGSSWEGSSSNPGSPLSSSPVNGSGLGPGFDPSALVAGGSSTPRAPSPLQQSHTAISSSNLMDIESSAHSGASGSSTSPTILPHFSSSPSGSSISHNHRDSRTIDFATAVKGWESPLFTVTTLPPPIPIGQHSLSSLRAAAAASERARSPKPLSLGEAHGTAGGMMGAPSLSPDRASQNGSASSGSAHYNGPSRKTSGSFTKHPVVEHAHDSILTSPKFKSIPLTSLSPSSPPKAAVASSGVSLSNISRPISPRINAWPSGSSHVSPGSSPSGASFHFGSNPGSRLHRPTSPSIRLEHDGRGRTPSPSRARDGSGISRGASLSPPLDADAQNMRMRPVSPSSWDSSWPEVSGGSRSVPIGLSSSPHGRSGGVRLERNFSNGSGSSSGGSPGTSPVASSTVFSNSATGLGIAPGAWKFPSSPRGGGKKMLSRSPRPGRDSGSSASRSRSQSPSQPLGQSDRPRNTDRDSEGSQGNPSSPVTATSSGESASNAHVSPRDLLYIRNRSVSSSSSSSGNSSEGSNGMEESSQPRRPPKRSAHGRTVSIDSAGRSSQPSGRARHARKASDPSPSLMKDPPSAMRIAHGTPRTEVDARQALSESTKGKAGAAGGLIADEVDAFSDQLPLPAIPARAHMEGSTGMSIDEADPLSRPVTSSANPSHSPMTAVAGLGSSYSLLVRPTPVDARLLPPFEASPMARMGSGNAPSNALGLGPDSMASGLHSPHNPFNTQSTLSPRLGASPLPLSERTLLGMRSRSPSPAAMIAPSPFDPLRRQSPSPSPLANTLDALNGESPPKMRSFIGMPPRSGYNLSDDPDDVGSEGDDGTASSASSTDGREGSMGGDDDDGMDEKEDDEEEGEDRTIRADSDSGDDQDSQHGMGGRRELRGLPSDISRSTLFARRQNTSSSSADGDVEDNREVHDDGSAEGSDGREQRRGMRESRAPSPPTESTEAPSRPPMYARKPSLTRSNQVLLPPELEDDDEAAGARNGRMSSALDFFHGDDPESQLDESAGWGTPLSRQISNGTRELSMVSQEDDDEDADASVGRDGDADWVPPSSQSMAPDQEDPASESEEALTTLERIFLFAKSEMTYHRILVSQCLAEWILDVKLSDAVEFIIPLLNGLSTDEHEVCENFSPELHRIMWFFFRNCPLKGQAETANGSAHVNGSAEETAIRPQLDIGTFTPLLCALLLNQNTGIARSTQNAIVQFCSRLHRDSEGTLLSDDGSWSPEMSERCEGDHTFLIISTVNRDGKDISYEPYLFGPEARKRVEEEILQNVAIAIGSQNAYQPQQEGRDSTQTTDENAAERNEAASGSALAEMSRTDSQESKGDGAGTSQETSGEVSRDDSSWDPESQMDSRMEDVWRSDGNLFDASSPQVGPVAGEFDEEAAVARMAGVTMLAALAGEGILHVDIITDKFVPQMVGLEKDPAFFVRKEVAVSLGILAKAVTDEGVIKEHLLPTLDTYLQDKIWHVRQAACLSMPAVLSKTDDETQRSRAVSYLRALASDISRYVRSAALEIIGELVYLFHEKEGGVPEELIRFFLNEPLDGPDEEMAGTDKSNEHSSSQSQPKFELSNVTSDYGFVDALQLTSESAWGAGMYDQSDVHERAVVTAFNFPAVVVTMGPQHWARLQPLHTKLAQDDAVKVRRSLASSLHEIAKIVGAEASQAHLLPIFEQFLQDYENEIKTAVVEHVDVFLAQLPQEHALSALRSMQTGWMQFFGRDWRLRERLAQHISTMADTFLLSDEDANLIALMQLAIADPVSAVRDAGIQSIAKMYTIFSEHDQAAADGFLALVDELGNSTSYRIRVASLMAIEALVHGSIQRAAIETILLERLVAAAEDEVIDVRIVLARCVTAMCLKDELYGLSQSRSPTFLELIAKLARDSSFEVRQPIQATLSEDEASAAEQDAQANPIRLPNYGSAARRNLVLGPKEGGPHRGPRMSSFSTNSMDQREDPDLDVDVDVDVDVDGDGDGELQAFAMDEDVVEHGSGESGPTSGQSLSLPLTLPHQQMQMQFGSAAGETETAQTAAAARAEAGDVEPAARRQEEEDDEVGDAGEDGNQMHDGDGDGTSQVQS